MALPAELTYLIVEAKLTRTAVDSADAGAEPDGVPLSGQVTFKPNIGKTYSNGNLKGGGRITVNTATGTEIVVVAPVPVTLAAGAFTIELVDPKCPAIINNSNWTWTAHFDLTDPSGAVVPQPDITFDSPPDSQLVNLADEVDVEISTGGATFINEAAASATASAASAVSAAASAVSAAQAASLVGAPADAAVAALAGNPASATRAALSATYGPVLAARSPSAGQRIFDQDLKLITSFQAGHGYANLNGVGTGNTFNVNCVTEAEMGSQCVQFITSGNGGGVTAAKVGMAAIDLTGRVPAVLVKVDDLTKLRSIVLMLGSTGLANRYTWYAEIELTTRTGRRWLVSGEWVWITFPWGCAAVTGAPSKANITDVQVKAEDNTDGPVTIRFNAVGHTKATTTWPNGVLSFSFDDNFLSTFTKAKPALDKYGFAATAFVICERLANPPVGYFTADQARNLQNLHGWDIGYHSYWGATHLAGFDQVTPEALLADVQLARQYLISEGFAAVDHLAYPMGYYDASVLALLRPYFRSGRGNLATMINRESLMPVDPMRTRIFWFDATTPVATITGAIDTAYANGEWLQLCFHELVAAGAVAAQRTEADFQTIVAYAATKGIPVRTTSEVMRTRP